MGIIMVKKKTSSWKDYINVFKTIDSRFFYSMLLDFAFVLFLIFGFFFIEMLLRGFISKMEPLVIETGLSAAVASMDASKIEAINAPLSGSASYAIAILISFFASYILCFFFWTLTRSILWNILLKQKFSFKRWMKFTLTMLIWGVVFVLPSLLFFYMFLAAFVLPNINTSNYILAMWTMFLLAASTSIFFLLYLHFTNILYYKFTLTKKLSIGYALKNGVIKIRLFIVPLLFIIFSFIIFSAVSMILNLLPEVVLLFISTVLLFCFLNWTRWYYVKLLEKHKF